MIYTLQDKQEFILQYVLNRALTRTDSLTPVASAEEAAAAWDYALKECKGKV
jgi:hypothetical protein